MEKKTRAFSFALFIQLQLSLSIPTANTCRYGRELLLPIYLIVFTAGPARLISECHFGSDH